MTTVDGFLQFTEESALPGSMPTEVRDAAIDVIRPLGSGKCEIILRSGVTLTVLQGPTQIRQSVNRERPIVEIEPIDGEIDQAERIQR